ncbi:unnamed protein product [Psylliodes chrysocephalus]|uniref:SWIM-type domain-containing protein n=1 Tax=Psylliodes chrysocephalus TaxID=3402493 RepID=A0A9P0DAS3_9CUCU|nr:unnamed protein product [Psylliodes chrysocephala]
MVPVLILLVDSHPFDTTSKGFSSLRWRYGNFRAQDLTGVFQIRLALSYIQDNLGDGRRAQYQVDLDGQDGLLRVRTSSRYRDGVRHQLLWIAFTNESVEDDENAVVGYYCTCQVEVRTLGTCSHIATVAWFLGYARHQENVKYPPTVLLDRVRDARANANNHFKIEVVEMD